MRLLKKQVLLRLVNSYIVDSPQPANISYLWNFGSLLGTCLILQILTGIFLAMHYQPHVDFAFNSVEHIMRDVNNGWAVRYTHANVASFFFIFVYAHIARGLYYGSYKSPRVLLWAIGVIILVVMMATAFLGYVLPYGQMSLWGATVITNLLSAIPVFGQDLVELIWGGFSVSNATLNRFFSLHYLLPFLLAALVVAHLIALHTHGSNNPNGIGSSSDRITMHPYFTFKDLVTIFLFFLVLSILVFYYPNFLGHSDNYIPANPMQTPASIVPEWYLLPFYAILRSIPNKLLGVIAMFGSLLILLVLPLTDLSRIRGSQFRPLMKLAFWFFVVDFFILMWIGSQHPVSPYVEIGQISTAFYFIWFLAIVPAIGLIENSLFDTALDDNKNTLTPAPKIKEKGYFNKQMKLLKRILCGFKKGLITPNLPSDILKLQNKPLIRILRVLGGISIILILTHKLDVLGSGLLYLTALYLCFIVSILFCIYLMYVNFHRIKYMCKVFNSDKLEVRNSPLDRLATHLAKVIWCAKGACDVAAPIGITFGAMTAIDEIRKAKGYDPIFLPFIADLLLPDTEETARYKEKTRLYSELSRNNTNINYYDKEISFINDLEKDNVITASESSDWKQIVKENKGLLTDANQNLKSKILDALSNEKNKP